MSKTVCFIYGFGEDRWNGRFFAKKLEAAGYKVIDEPAEAEIVIAHSAGCFYLPDTGVEQLTVLIGPPYWPGRSPIVSFFIKWWGDLSYYVKQGRPLAWIHKTVHNTLYILFGLRKAVAIARNANHHDFYLALKKKRVLIIRNENDAFLTPKAPELLRNHANFTFRTLPGEHDDCWLHPQPYINLIQLGE